jgi:putative effector of murein hydrolase LrgA (UPF0299 family)
VKILDWLTIVFVVLKLTHVIAWSWWWVLAPAWISLILVVTLVALAHIVERKKHAN